MIKWQMSPVQNREKVAKKGTWHRSKTRDRYNKTCTHCDALVKSTLHPTLFTYASLECTSATYSPTAHLLLILALPLNVAVRPICATLSSVRKRSLLSLPLLLGDGQEELELRGQLLFRVEAVGEVNPADSAVGMNLDPQRLDIVRAIRSAGEVTEVELDLVPPLIQTHRHRTDKRLDARCALVVGRTESSTDVLVVQHLNLEGEVLLEIL